MAGMNRAPGTGVSMGGAEMAASQPIIRIVVKVPLVPLQAAHRAAPGVHATILSASGTDLNVTCSLSPTYSPSIWNATGWSERKVTIG